MLGTPAKHRNPKAVTADLYGRLALEQQIQTSDSLAGMPISH